MLYTNKQLRQYCEGLGGKEREDLYRQTLNKAKEAIENSKDIDQIKELSRFAVAIEEITDKELLKEFNADNPLREVSLVVCSPESVKKVTNYLFSLSDSSELYDLKEDGEKAIYQAIKSNDVELVKQLLIVLLPDIHFEEINLEHLEELKISLSQSYGELKPKLSKDMENYLDKKLSLYRFLCDNFNLLATKPIDIKAIISLFKAQPEVDYQVDKFLVSLIIENSEALEKEELDISNMIEFLEKHERFAELEYKVRRLKSELKSGKSKYPAEVIKASIAERENEMKKIEEKYIKPTDLAGERDKLLKAIV